MLSIYMSLHVLWQIVMRPDICMMHAAYRVPHRPYSGDLNFTILCTGGQCKIATGFSQDKLACPFQ